MALSLTVLLGLAALVVDVGLNWAARTSAQTAADSAALAGASRLLVDGPAAAIDTVGELLNKNFVTPVGAGWALDGLEDNGEIVCWTLPAPPPTTVPPPALRCPEGSNALRVITPPVQVQYAFAPVLGKRSNSIKAMAAAAAGPAAPNNCVLCVLEPAGDNALLLTGLGGIDVNGGGIVVNSQSALALHLLGLGDISADQIRVLGDVSLPGQGQLLPPAELGGPPAVDPLEDLLSPDRLPTPPPGGNTAQVIASGTTATLPPGVYPSIEVQSDATLNLQPGVYVVTHFTSFAQEAGFTVRANGHVIGNGVTIYLACDTYPIPCTGGGATIRLENDSDFQVDPPATGEYAGLSIFSDQSNTRTMQLRGPVNLTGAVYAASARLSISSPGTVQIDGLVAVDRLLEAGAGPLQVTYDPSSPLIGIGRPVLLR